MIELYNANYMYVLRIIYSLMTQNYKKCLKSLKWLLKSARL